MPEPDPIRTEEHIPEPSRSLERTASRTNTVGGIEPGGPPPDGVPGYEILRELGRGGMGVVYHARQSKLNREVALKMVLGGPRTSDRERHRFLAEAEAIAAVKNDNVVQVYDYGELSGCPYMALEYVPGGTLAEQLKKRGAVGPKIAAALVAKIARGVAAAHATGIIHRDLKPANVLLTSTGEPKVSDFGLAKRGVSELTQTGQVMGTPAYMAPEQASGGTKFVGPPADVWALGVILHECLSGSRPFRADSTDELLARILTADPAAMSGAPRDLVLICRKCLEKNATDRYATAAELADDLDRHVRGEPIHVRPAGLVERTYKWAKRKPTAAALCAALAALVPLIAFAGIVSYLWRETE